ncbi:MAG: DUF1330 domain-containing protein [Pseudomonadales bacterium]|nr:DUF1330 domain-containing protein [Pseudomonadales bacterium]
MTVNCTVILEGTFRKGGKTSSAFEEYSQRSTANGEAHGGVVVKNYLISENLGQGEKPDFILVVEYPSQDKAIKAFTCDEYRRILSIRDSVFKEVKILLV